MMGAKAKKEAIKEYLESLKPLPAAAASKSTSTSKNMEVGAAGGCRGCCVDDAAGEPNNPGEPKAAAGEPNNPGEREALTSY